MDISKLVPNVDEIIVRFNKTPVDTTKAGLVEIQVNKMLFFVTEYKKWSSRVATYSQDSILQNLPLEYYQLCARQHLLAYEQQVQEGIPQLVLRGVIDKNGNLL